MFGHYERGGVVITKWATDKLTSVWRLARASKLFQDASKMLALQFAGRAIAFFASAYAMRSLGPEQLGIGAFVLSIVAQGAVLGDLGLNIAGVRALGNDPDRRDEIVSLVWGVRLRVAIVLSALMLVGVRVFHPVGSMTLWLLATPLLILSVLSPQWIFQGMERAPAFNAIQLVQTVITALLYFGLFRPGAHAELYMTVALITQALGWGLSYIVLRRQVDVNWLNFDWHQAWEMVRAGGCAFAIVLSISVYTILELPLITFILSPKEAGFYRAAQGMVQALNSLLSIVPVLLYPRLIVWKNMSIEVFVKKSRFTMLVLSGSVALIVVVSSIVLPFAFRILLGGDFEEGVWLSVLLMAAKSIILVAGVPAWGLLAFGLDKQYLIVVVTVALFSTVGNILLIPYLGLTAVGWVNIAREILLLFLSTLALQRSIGMPLLSCNTVLSTPNPQGRKHERNIHASD